MKHFLILSCFISLVGAQDTVEPIDLAMLVADKEPGQPLTVPDLFRGVGLISDFDFIAVVYGEHISQARLIGLKGMRTGVINPSNGENGNSVVVYIPQFTNEHAPLKSKVEKIVDPRKYNKMLDIAWNLANHSEVGVQSKNLDKDYESLTTCYFMISSRLFTTNSAQSMLGGYIQNPIENTKSSRLIEMIFQVIGEFNRDDKKSDK